MLGMNERKACLKLLRLCPQRKKLCRKPRRVERVFCRVFRKLSLHIGNRQYSRPTEN